MSESTHGTLRQALAFFLVTTVTVFAGACWYVAATPPRYAAQAVIAFAPKRERPVSAAVVTLTAPRYVAFASSPFTIRRAAEPLRVHPAELQRHLTVTMTAPTANVTVSVELEDPGEAARAANRIAELVLAQAAGDPVLAGQLLARATVPTTPAGPGRGLQLIGAAVAAMLAGGLVAVVVRGYLRRRDAVVARGVAAVGAVDPPPARPASRGLWDETVVLRLPPELADAPDRTATDAGDDENGVQSIDDDSADECADEDGGESADNDSINDKRPEVERPEVESVDDEREPDGLADPRAGEVTVVVTPR